MSPLYPSDGLWPSDSLWPSDPVPTTGPSPIHPRVPVGDPRRRLEQYRQLARVGGIRDAVPPFPIVITVGVNGVGATFANVIGSVNPNGGTTSWWISYGTSLPLPFGTSTTPIAIGNGTLPITVTASLTGLTTGATYYVSVVGQSAAGTVYGETLSFVAQAPVTTPASPIVPYGQPSVTIPHFQVPFQLTTSGAIVVEQDTLEEVLSSVNTIVECVIGECDILPTFGRPDLAFAQEPIDTAELVDSIQQWEPRATEDVVSELALDGENWNIALSVSSTSARGT